MDPADTLTPTKRSLPNPTYYQVIRILRTSLPLPVSDDPDDEALRIQDAIAHVASLLPATPDEAHIAAQYVAALAQISDCQRQAHEHAGNPALAMRCQAQANSNSRQARGWRSTLMKAQAERCKRDASPAARAAAEQVERVATALLFTALDHAPPISRPATPPAPEAAPAAAPRSEPAEPSVLAAAERYATIHRKRAILIRRAGHLPNRSDVGHVPPEVVHAIVTGTTPVLRSLDQKSRPRPTAIAA